MLLMLSAVSLLAQGPRSDDGRRPHGSVCQPASTWTRIRCIEQHLNAEVPADLAFTDELGNPVKLAGLLWPMGDPSS